MYLQFKNYESLITLQSSDKRPQLPRLIVYKLGRRGKNGCLERNRLNYILPKLVNKNFYLHFRHLRASWLQVNACITCRWLQVKHTCRWLQVNTGKTFLLVTWHKKDYEDNRRWFRMLIKTEEMFYCCHDVYSAMMDYDVILRIT